MSKRNDSPNCNTAKDEGTAAQNVGVASVLGLVIGTLLGGPLWGIALAAIYGGTAVLCAAAEHTDDSSDNS
jgi:hypothetical protein